MLSSISPVGERARGQRFAVTATAYTIGSVLGGAAVTGLLGGFGALLLADLKATTALAALGVAAAAGLVVDRSRRLPTWTRQVDERWLSTYRGWVYGLGYGVQLGAGVVTIVPASVIYLMLVAAALTGSPAHGAVIGAVFGFTRALPLPLTARVQTPAALRRTLAAMQRGNLWAVRGVVVGQGLVALVALVAVVAVVGRTA